MSLQDMLRERMDAAEALYQRAEQIDGAVEGRGKLCSKLRAELRFLRRADGDQVALKASHLNSTNLTHLRAVLDSAESLEGVVAVLRVFSYRDADGRARTLTVDVVGDGGRTWVKSVGRKAEALHNIWEGRGRYGAKTIVGQAEDFALASQQRPLGYVHPRVVFAFYNGVSEPVARRLEEMGVAVRGDVVAVDAVVTEGGEEVDGEDDEEDDDDDEGDEPESVDTRVDRSTVLASLAFPADAGPEECGRVNLDITALIAYVSSLSHGRCRLAFREPVLTEQAAQERLRPVLPVLEAVMADKELYACRAAVDDFQTILNTLGGPGEKERARLLLGRLRLVDDRPSERALALAPSAKVNRRSLLIFGTGDRLRALTLTANARFVRAAANQGVRFSVFVHEPRALTEGKEWRATPVQT
ncbi:UPF0415 protein C7orf25 homolog [Stigmatopora nigra]